MLVSANPDAELAALADVHICVETGPEVLAGSTRMKAGTAQKLVLNAFSTATMVRLGHTYSNLMTGVVAKNAKLHGRMVAILAEASGRDLDTCAEVLRDSDGDLKLALVRLLGDVDADTRPHRPRRGRWRHPHRAAPPRPGAQTYPPVPEGTIERNAMMTRSILGLGTAGLGCRHAGGVRTVHRRLGGWR